VLLPRPLKTPMEKYDFPKQGRGEKKITHTHNTSKTETLKK
jgi:hypothetical protein